MTPKDIWGTSLRGAEDRRDRLLTARFAEVGYTFLRMKKWEGWATWNKSHYHMYYAAPAEEPGEEGQREYCFMAQSFERLEAFTADPYTLAGHLYSQRRIWWERAKDMEGHRKREEWARDGYGRACAERAGFVLGSVFYLGPKVDGLNRVGVSRLLRVNQQEAFLHLRLRVAETRAVREEILGIIGPPPLAEG